MTKLKPRKAPYKRLSKDVFYRTTKLFSQITGTPINLQLIKEKGVPYLTKKKERWSGKERYEIKIYTQNHTNDLFNYRCLTHELSHVFFGTFNINKQQIFEKYKGRVDERIIGDVLNIIEDYRVDTLWWELYEGSRVIDSYMFPHYAQNIQPNEPLDILRLVALGAKDKVLVTGDKEKIWLAEQFEEILNRVRGSSYIATMAAAIEVIHKITKYYTPKPPQQQQLPQLPPTSFPTDTIQDDSNAITLTDTTLTDDFDDISGNGGDSSTGSSTDSDVGDMIQPRSEIHGEEEAKDLNDLIEETNQLLNEQEQKQEETDVEDQLLDQLFCSECGKLLRGGRCSHCDNSSQPGHIPITSIDADFDFDDSTGYDLDFTIPLHELYDNAQQEGQEVVKELKEKLEQIKLTPPSEKRGIIGRVVDEISFSSTQLYHPDLETAERLANVLSRLKGKVKEILEEEGIEPDIDMLIQKQSNPDVSELFIDEQEEQGLDVVILLDVSASMSSSRKLTLAATACLTLWKALEKVSGIDFSVYAFTGQTNELVIKKLTYNELQRVVPMDVTPTWSAVRYVVNQLETSQNEKLLILITDGVPYTSNLPDSITEWLTSKEIKRARSKGIKVFTFFIRPNYTDYRLTKMFGVGFTWVILDQSELLPKLLYQFVTNHIVKHFAKGSL